MRENNSQVIRDVVDEGMSRPALSQYI